MPANTPQVITQCSMRHLYADKDAQEQISAAKQYERRRCGHHTLETPLSTLECLRQVVDPNDNKTNKHRYVVASQDAEVRAHMRGVAGVPLIFIKRSVVILEPMAETTGLARMREEKARFRVGLRGTKSSLGKRARAEEENEQEESNTTSEVKTKRKKGPKGPNPLSALKPKKRDAPGDNSPERRTRDDETAADVEDEALKKKRRRKSSKRTDFGTEVGEV
jgi:U3 small nucleolar RNA-associated protein 23